MKAVALVFAFLTIVFAVILVFALCRSAACADRDMREIWRAREPSRNLPQSSEPPTEGLNRQ